MIVYIKEHIFSAIRFDSFDNACTMFQAANSNDITYIRFVVCLLLFCSGCFYSVT